MNTEPQSLNHEVLELRDWEFGFKLRAAEILRRKVGKVYRRRVKQG